MDTVYHFLTAMLHFQLKFDGKQNRVQPKQADKKTIPEYAVKMATSQIHLLGISIFGAKNLVSMKVEGANAAENLLSGKLSALVRTK